MALQVDGIGQEFLIPKKLTEFIPQNDICFFIEKIVDSLDFKEIDDKYRGTPGKPAYPRKMLLRLTIQAGIDGIFSSRKISMLTEQNIKYMYLSGLKKPDHNTICRFKIECKELIKETFKITVKIADQEGILNLNHIAVDGTKMKANANTRKKIKKQEIYTIEEAMAKGIMTDEEENQLYGDKRGDELPETLQSKKHIQKQVQKLQKHKKEIKKQSQKHEEELEILKKQENTNKKQKKEEKELEKLKKKEEINKTDPESRIMKNKKGKFENAYNIQISTEDNGIILENDVTQDPTDHNQLIPQLEGITDTIGEIPEETAILADNGYFTDKNIKYLDENNLDGYIPNKKQATLSKKGKKGVSEFSKHNFTYDRQKNLFICPNGEKLPYKREYQDEDTGKIKRLYYTNKCKNCPNQEKCAGNDRYRIITDYYTPAQHDMAEKMESDEGKEKYSKRKEIVEYPFGHIKHNLKYNEFQTRGLEKVKTETNILSAVHNIRRIYNIKNDIKN